MAALNGHPDTCELLLKYNADVNAVDTEVSFMCAAFSKIRFLSHFERFNLNSLQYRQSFNCKSWGECKTIVSDIFGELCARPS